MSDPKFTTAPWKLVRREVMEDGSVYPTHIVSGPEEFQVCTLESSVIAKAAIDNPGERWGISDANARLICAAPELLEACQMLLVCMNLANWEGDPAAEKARLAIAKATGA